MNSSMWFLLQFKRNVTSICETIIQSIPNSSDKNMSNFIEMLIKCDERKEDKVKKHIAICKIIILFSLAELKTCEIISDTEWNQMCGAEQGNHYKVWRVFM